MRIRKGFILREVAGEKVIVATGELAKTHRNIIVLNKSGAILWELMQDDFSVDQLERKTLDRFSDADPQTVRTDILEFLDFLKEKSILESGNAN